MKNSRQRPSYSRGDEPKAQERARGSREVLYGTEHHGRHRAPTVDLIQQCAAIDAIEASGHAAERLLERYITIDAVKAALCNKAAILEDYPDDPRGHCCKVECENSRGDVWHCVCAVIEDEEAVGGLTLLIITTFEP